MESDDIQEQLKQVLLEVLGASPGAGADTRLQGSLMNAEGREPPVLETVTRVIQIAPAPAGEGRSAVAAEEILSLSAGVSTPASESPLTEEIQRLVQSLTQLRATGEKQAETQTANTQALLDNTAAQGQSKARAALNTVSEARSFLGGAFGLAPLFGALFRLFGGSKKEEPPPLVEYALPKAIDAQAGLLASGRLSGIDYYAGGQVRIDETNPPAAAGLRPAAGLPQVTVQVQAMDSRSFLDHSEEIARAVREAMLHSHPINDVISEL